MGGALGEILFRLRDERCALGIRRLGVGEAARLLLCPRARKPAFMRCNKAVDVLFFDAAGRTDDGLSITV